MAQLLRPGGDLAEYFLLKETETGPPFGTTPEALHALLDPHFELVVNNTVTDFIAVLQGAERWQVWRQR